MSGKPYFWTLYYKAATGEMDHALSLYCGFGGEGVTDYVAVVISRVFVGVGPIKVCLSTPVKNGKPNHHPPYRNSDALVLSI